MKTFSIKAILLLCFFILLVDIMAFYWLLAITKPLISPVLMILMYIFFWFFSLALIAAIIILKVRMEKIAPHRKYLWISSLYGITVTSFIPKIIFVIVISMLFFLNIVFYEEESIILIPIIGVFSGFLPFLVIIYGIFRTLYRFKIYEEHLSFKKLPKSFSGLKIVQISDTHLGSFNFRYHILERAVRKINHLQPDFIFFTGDLVNNYAWELKGWESYFNNMKAKFGKFAVLGNHDYGDYTQWETPEHKHKNLKGIKHFFYKTGFRLLMNEAEIIENKNEKIAILGVENWGKPPFKQYGILQNALKQSGNIPFKILLSHDPTHWTEEVRKKTNIALTLSGHTHGMQAGIRIKNMKWSPIQLKFKHWAGLYHYYQQFLYVNRGLGWLGFPGRIGMRPEITLIHLLYKK